MFIRTAQKYLTPNKPSHVLDDSLKMLKQNPTDTNLMIQVGDLYLKNNQMQEAIRYFGKAADSYLGEGFLGKAIAIYRRVLKLNPEQIDIRLRLADLHFRERHMMEAKTLLESAIQSCRQ